MFCFVRLAVVAMTLAASLAVRADDLPLRLQSQVETSPGSGRYRVLVAEETWRAEETAIVVCDVWDYHHCFNAVQRLEEFAPRLNDLLRSARERGVTIVHAPSDCMEAYADHPARRRAVEAPAAPAPPNIDEWCSRIPAEERAAYPIDQSDGGEDDDPQAHAEWADELKSLGRNPSMPWKRQSPAIDIDAERDFISDRGDEVWNVLALRGVKNVILTGVHLNMCVLGRPFGLRNMVAGGKRTVLLRDLTDSMYNPASWPYVSHLTANDLVVSHIERFVCSTITSDQFLGGRPFRFADDRRPRLAILSAEDEYATERTLPEFARAWLDRDFSVRFIFGDDADKSDIPGLAALADADVALVSVRRRVLPEASLAIVREFVKAGKPVVGIRTASHAFSLRDQAPPAGHAAWPEFDAQVFGGSYHGHHANDARPSVRAETELKDSSVLEGVDPLPFESGGSLYQTSPLAKGTETILVGQVLGHPPEPAAWTFIRADGGRSFYTSLGHASDFENRAFLQLLTNALHWAVDLPIEPERLPPINDFAAVGVRLHWMPLLVPEALADAMAVARENQGERVWMRCVVRIPKHWQGKPLRLEVPHSLAGDAWCNGKALEVGSPRKTGGTLNLPADSFVAGDANLLVIRIEPAELFEEPCEAPVLRGPESMTLAGRWQVRVGGDDERSSKWSNMPLPAKFGASTDIVFEVQP